jgi:hypothetical protein
MVALSLSSRDLRIEGAAAGATQLALAGDRGLVALSFVAPSFDAPESVSELCQCSSSAAGPLLLLPAWTPDARALFVHSRVPEGPLLLRYRGASFELAPAGRAAAVVGVAESWLNLVRAADSSCALRTVPASSSALIGSVERAGGGGGGGPWRRLVVADGAGRERLLCLDAVMAHSAVMVDGGATAFQVPLIRDASALSFLPALNPFATGGVFVSPVHGGTVVSPGGPQADASLTLSAPSGALEASSARVVRLQAPVVRIEAGEVRTVGALRCEGEARFGGASGVFDGACIVRGALSCSNDVRVEQALAVGGRLRVGGEVQAVGGIAAAAVTGLSRIVGGGNAVALLAGDYAYDDPRLAPRFFPSGNAARYYGERQLAEAMRHTSPYDGGLLDSAWVYADAIESRDRNAGTLVQLTNGRVDVMADGGALRTRTDASGLLVVGASASNADRDLQLTLRASGAPTPPSAALLAMAPPDMRSAPIVGMRLETDSGEGGGLLSIFAGSSTGVLQTASGGRLELNPAGGAVLANGVPLQTVSDARLKTGIEDIGPCSALLRRLRPRTYRLRHSSVEEGRGSFEAGLVAQEVYEAAPELRHLVSLPEDADPDSGAWGERGPLGLNYTGLVPYLLRALQEHAELIERLTMAGGA